MKVIPQYKVIGPYKWQDYTRYKKLMLRDKIEVTVKRKDPFSLKIQICVISQSIHFQTLWLWSILPAMLYETYTYIIIYNFILLCQI